MNRPMVWAAVAFTAGIWASGMSGHPWIWITALVVLALLLWRLPYPLLYRDGFPIAALFLIAGAAVELNQRPARLSDSLSDYARAHPELIYRLEGTVTDAPLYMGDPDYLSVRFRADRVSTAQGTVPVSGHVVIRWSNPTRGFHRGERIRVQGRIEPGLGEVNFGVQGVEGYYRTLGYHSAIRARGDQVAWVASPTWDPFYWASRLRQWQAELFESAAPPEIQVFLRAVWLGDRATYSEEDYRPYLETGSAHILSVSGVHVAIIYLSLTWMLQPVVRTRKYRSAIVIAVVVVFAVMTGARPPILRAAIMIGLYLWAELLERESDAPTALSIAALLFLGINPSLLWDTSFVLSFGSLASILVFSEAVAERLTAVPLWLRQEVATAIGVSILPFPLAAHFFHLVPLMGSLTNLLIIPALTGILWLCMAMIVTGAVSVPVASLFGHAATPLVHLIEWAAKVFSQVPLAYVELVSPTLGAALLFIATAIALARCLFVPERRRQWGGICVATGVLCVAFWTPLRTDAGIDLLDVGHGDAIVVRTPGGTTLLVDAGDRSEHVDMGKRVVVPWLHAHGMNRIDYLVVTHPDRDHIGGAESVLAQVAVGAVILWPEPTDNPLELSLIAACERLEVPVVRVGSGDSLPAAGASISVLHPTLDSAAPGVNNQSIVLHVAWPGLTALLSGDIHVEAERELLGRLGPVVILKVPHHGSHTSSSEAFIEALSPRVALVSTRGGNRREAMGREVVPRYEARGIPLYRTDYHGGIRVRQRGGEIEVRGARADRGYTLEPAGDCGRGTDTDWLANSTTKAGR